MQITWYSSSKRVLSINGEARWRWSYGMARAMVLAKLGNIHTAKERSCSGSSLIQKVEEQRAPPTPVDSTPKDHLPAREDRKRLMAFKPQTKDIPQRKTLPCLLPDF
ncbi:hypothetical protein TNCV_112881 [Trichonephila clavipes]|nr:hypothetical protein TNCV_112881 [Trichonephila clavipes]